MAVAWQVRPNGDLVVPRACLVPVYVGATTDALLHVAGPRWLAMTTVVNYVV